MKILDMYSLPGDISKHNEDKIGFNGNSIWILDGATSFIKTTNNIYNSDAAWFSNEFNKLLKKNSDCSIKDNLYKSLSEIEKIYNNIKLKKITQEWEHPSAQMAMVQYFENDKKINLAQVGDTRAIIKYKNGNVDILSYGFIDKLDDRNIKKIIRKYPDFCNLSLENKLKLIKPLIQKSRKKYMNARFGYPTVSTSLKILENDAVLYKEFDVNDIDVILLATDGFLSIVENYKKYNMEKLIEIVQNYGIEYVVKTIRDIEEEDKECLKYIRFKKSDDTSAILIGF